MRRKKRRFRPVRFLSFLLGWALLWNFACGVELDLHYNKEKAAESRKNFWEKALVVVKYAGDVRRAIW